MAFDGKTNRAEAMRKQFNQDNAEVKKAQKKTEKTHNDEQIKAPVFKMNDKGGFSYCFAKSDKITPEMLFGDERNTTFRIKEDDYVRLKKKAKKLGFSNDSVGVRRFLKLLFNPSKSLKLEFGENIDSCDVKGETKAIYCPLKKSESLRLEEMKNAFGVKTNSKMIRIILTANKIEIN